MADEEEPHSLASTFPNPPPFWKDFTPDNLARIDTLRREAVGQSASGDENNNNNSKRDASGGGHKTGAEDGDAAQDSLAMAATRLPDLPSELANLQPPAEPGDGRWRVFGDQYMLNDQLPTLEEQGITNLPAAYAQSQPQSQSQSQSQQLPQQQQQQQSSRDAKHYDRALELKRFAKSILLNFLELSGTLARNPAHAQPKVADLRDLFINMHHALNEYRPHQARESVIEMMQDHLDRTRRETAAIRTQVDRARRVLEGLGSLAVSAPSQPGAAGVAAVAEMAVDEDAREADELEKLQVEREAEIWAGTDALFA